MSLSQHDRDDLFARVERRLVGRNISRETVRATVDRVCALLESSGATSLGATSSAGADELMVTFNATSFPDLQSRVRRALAEHGVAPSDVGAATVGRHTVVTMRLAASAREAAERAAASVGCSVVISGSVGAGE